MNKSELINDAREYLSKCFEEKYPDFADKLGEDFDLILRPTVIVSKDDPQIQFLVNGVFWVFLRPYVHSCTQLYILVKQFANAFREYDKVVILKSIWLGKNENNKLNLAVPDIEAILFRDLSSGNFRLGKKYNVAGRFGSKAYYTLSDLNFILQSSKEKIMDVFFEVSVSHSVEVPFQMQNFQQSTEGMPLL